MWANACDTFLVGFIFMQYFENNNIFLIISGIAVAEFIAVDGVK
jgi:hypothetical protein